MNKPQLLILLLIIVLLFYFWSEEKTYRPESLGTNWVIKKPLTPQPTQPFIAPFGPNPPHSRLDEPPLELPKAKKSPSPEPLEPVINRLANISIPDPEFINLPGPQWVENNSELSEAERKQRKTQEEADYHWLLNNKTITDWHHEHQLTDTQFQTLRSLVNQEEMNTLQHFLNLLPINYEWRLISPEFKNQTLITHWKERFTLQQTQEWLSIGLTPHDYTFAAWLANTKHLTPDEVLNLADFEKLKAEFTHHGN